MTIKYILGVVVVSMSLLSTSAHAIPTTYLYNGSDEITGVASLDINGALWDMTLHDGSYTSLYQTLGAVALYEVGFAFDASEALASFTNTRTDLASSFVGCTFTSCRISTVISLYDNGGQLYYDAYHVDIKDGPRDSVGVSYDFDAELLDPAVTFATWSRVQQTVPEPSVVLLIASGLMVLGIARRKDRT